jgi:hypothetical protein
MFEPTLHLRISDTRFAKDARYFIVLQHNEAGRKERTEVNTAPTATPSFQQNTFKFLIPARSRAPHRRRPRHIRAHSQLTAAPPIAPFARAHLRLPISASLALLAPPRALQRE